MDQQLQNYITQSRQSGASDEQIKKNLLDAGWQTKDVEEALKGTAQRVEPFVAAEKPTQAQDSQQQAPKWLEIVSKIYGALILALAVFVLFFQVSFMAFSEPKLLFSSLMLGFYGMIIVNALIGGGAWYMKRWVIALAAISFLNNIIIGFIFGFDNILSFVGGSIFLAIAYKYRKYFSGSFKAYYIYTFFIIGALLITFSAFYSPALGGVTNQEVDVFIEEIIQDPEFMEGIQTSFKEKLMEEGRTEEEADEIVNDIDSIKKFIKEDPEIRQNINFLLDLQKSLE